METTDDNRALTIAACSGCGCGFIYIHHDGIGCIACGSPVYVLPEPEDADDSPMDRQRWKAIMASRPATRQKGSQ